MYIQSNQVGLVPAVLRLQGLCVNLSGGFTVSSDYVVSHYNCGRKTSFVRRNGKCKHFESGLSRIYTSVEKNGGLHQIYGGPVGNLQDYRVGQDMADVHLRRKLTTDGGCARTEL